MSGDTYTHGHHASVLRSHAWRTAENSCGYLLPHLRDTDSLLDVGCGVGTITLDLAERLSNGSVHGIEPSENILGGVRAAATERGLGNVTIEVGDVYRLGLRRRHLRCHPRPPGVAAPLRPGGGAS